MRKYVSVTATFDPDGNILPLCIHWNDGRRFAIERVTDVRYVNSAKSGGLRYTCRIRSSDKIVYLEDNRWYVDYNSAAKSK